uniref:J domain-containing protein n=1 Tax=Leersia perrieri TaxID=77586 RepID=A0A0D9Y1C9_9ORYZ
MADLGLWKQAWGWVLSQKHILTWAHMAASGGTERLAFLVDRHWPAVSRTCVSSGRLVLAALRQWRGCAARGILEMASLGPASVFVILWSCFVCMTSPACALYALGAAGAVIHYMGYTPGMLLIAGGCMCSLKHARFVIPVLAMYAVYCVAVRVGSLGVFLTLNLSFLTNDLLNKLLQCYEGSTEERHFEETKHPDPVMDEFYRSCEFPSAPDSEPETVSSAKPFCSTPVQDVLHVQKEASPSKVVKSDSVSLDVMKRIMDGSTHYEVLGVPRNRSIDQKILKKEYHRMVLLVHPDKNMGNPLACESFKKLQSAYEILSDYTKKNSYDDQLRKEESRKMTQGSRVVSQQTGVEFLPEESRRIQCTKCGNFHVWICTKRSKAKARWCQDCSELHPAKDGDGWVENRFSSSFKMEIPRAFVCAESKIFDVSEWATCQGMECKPNTHGPSFMVNMVGADRMSQRSYSSRYPFSLNAEMIHEDEFELWLQQALASGVFSDSPKRRKSWSPFKLPQKGIKSWRRSS